MHQRSSRLFGSQSISRLFNHLESDPLFSEFRPKEPTITVRKEDPEKLSGPLGELARRFPVSSRSAIDVDFKSFFCWDLEIGKGVRIGFSFRHPDEEEPDQKQRYLNLQFLVRSPDSRENGLKALKSFLKALEDLRDNPVELVYYKYGPIRFDLIQQEGLETAKAERLDPVYSRLFKRKQIGRSEYYQLDYAPKHPRNLCN